MPNIHGCDSWLKECNNLIWDFGESIVPLMKFWEEQFRQMSGEVNKRIVFIILSPPVMI